MKYRTVCPICNESSIFGYCLRHKDIKKNSYENLIWERIAWWSVWDGMESAVYKIFEKHTIFGNTKYRLETSGYKFAEHPMYKTALETVENYENNSKKGKL